MTAILGISAFYHDSAAALIIDGEIIAAAQEERFTRKKHDPSYPVNSINYCLSEAGLSLSQVDYIAFYDKPFLKFERLLETYVAFAPKGLQSFRMAMPVWLREKLFLKYMLIKEIKKIDKSFDSNKLMFGEHHFSHAASAFYASPFEEAVVLTLDGVGEWATTTVSIGKGHELDIVKEIHFPHSLGLLYSAFTYYTGFRVNSGEYKVMGLAPYGEPKYKDLILEKLIDLKEDGSFRLNQSYFNYATGLTMVNQKFTDLFGEPVRKPDTDKLTQFHMDIAASVQAVTEDVVLTITRSLAKEYDIPVILAGGINIDNIEKASQLIFPYAVDLSSSVDSEPGKKDYNKLGYSTVGIKVYENKIFSLPIYLAIMTLLSGIIMFNSKYKKSKIFNIILGISLSVVIYYVNYFSGLLGETGKIPIVLSVWLPLIILILISSIGLVRLNEK